MQISTVVQAIREAGQVTRYHAIPHIKQQNDAEHSWNALNLILLLHPNPSVPLIKAVQWHDVAERWTGDMPSTAKEDPGVREGMHRIEGEVMSRLFSEEALMLSRESMQWLHAVDHLEAYLFCRENAHEPHLAAIAIREAAVIERMFVQGLFPSEAFLFFQMVQSTPYEPIPNKIEEL
jgi:5'-deoxynucleotidase YfbR-like HD superfamily hydrolase